MPRSTQNGAISRWAPPPSRRSGETGWLHAHWTGISPERGIAHSRPASPSGPIVRTISACRSPATTAPTVRSIAAPGRAAPNCGSRSTAGWRSSRRGLPARRQPPRGAPASDRIGLQRPGRSGRVRRRRSAYDEECAGQSIPWRPAQGTYCQLLPGTSPPTSSNRGAPLTTTRLSVQASLVCIGGAAAWVHEAVAGLKTSVV